VRPQVRGRGRSLVLPGLKKLGEMQVPCGTGVVVLAKVVRCVSNLTKYTTWSALIASVLYGTGSLVAPATLDTLFERMSIPFSDGTPPKALPLPLDTYPTSDESSLLPLKQAE
jgi:hypothetical protein